MATRRRAASAADDSPSAAAVRVLKKYPNRRLYDTQASAYVTLADVKQMVLAGEGFEVRDAKTGDDITRAILLQIILEEETAGVPLFSTQMLEQIIRFYGQAMQGVLQDYLAKNLQGFADMQQQFAKGGMAFTPDSWTQLMAGTMPGALPGMPNLMGSVLEQSQAMFQKMQEQMGSMGGLGGFPPPFGKK